MPFGRPGGLSSIVATVNTPSGLPGYIYDGILDDTIDFTTATYTPYYSSPGVPVSTGTVASSASGRYLTLSGTRDITGEHLLGIFTIRVTGEIIPEPSTITLLAGGMIGVLAYAWRKRR